MTTKDTLLNVRGKMSDETFAKQFNFLFAKYIDIKNKDKNAFYYKLLQHLTDAGLTRQEAENFLKNIRVKNIDLIQKIEETQTKIKESTEKFEKARFDLLTNPLNAKNYLVLFMETIRQINLTLQNIENKQLLNVINKEHFRDKVDEIRKLLEHSEQSISEKLKQDKEVGIDDVMLLQGTKVTFNKVAEKLDDLTAELAVNKTLTQNVNTNADKEKEQEKGGQEGKEKETETESVQNDLTLDKALENSLHATINSVNKELDEKTLSFLTLSEYLHTYNNYPLNEVFEKFSKIFDKDEFKAIVIYNNALQNNEVDDLFDFVVEQDFEAANINGYAEMLKHYYPGYKQMDEELKRELEPEIKKEKELEIGAPTKNKKFTSIDIG